MDDVDRYNPLFPFWVYVLLFAALLGVVAYDAYVMNSLIKESDSFECGWFSCTFTKQNRTTHTEITTQQWCYENGREVECT